MTRQKTILAHITFWVLYVALNHGIHVVQYLGTQMYLVDSICKYTVAAFIFYTTTLLLLPKLFARKRYLLFALSVIAMSFLSFLLKEGIFRLIPVFFDYPAVSAYSLKQSFLMNIWWWSQYTLWAFGYWYAIQAIEKEKALRKTREEQLQSEKERFELEREKLLLENAHLRAQINPHFLFNTLTFFYNQVSKSHPQVAEGIVALTDIMRSAIRKPDNDGKILLAEEIESIRSLITIYQLRYGNNLNINFLVTGQVEGYTMIPHILITLVENALTHGDLHSRDWPLIISLDLSGNQMTFKVSNKKSAGVKNPSHGIGMPYVRKQLEYAYRNRFEISITDDDRHYETRLAVALDQSLQSTPHAKIYPV